jgi:hypothetical protein
MQRILGASLLAIAACTPIDFHSEATTVTATGRAGTVDVSICAGPSDLLDCNEDHESFQVLLGNDSQEATEGFLSLGTLDAVFSTDVAEAPITVVCDAATIGTGSMPAPFTLSSPDAGATISRGGHVHLAWDADGADHMAWTVDLACSGTDYMSQPVDVDDTGAVSISSDDFPDGASGSCDGTLTLARDRNGSMTGLPEGSTLVAEQVGVVTFQLQQ